MKFNSPFPILTNPQVGDVLSGRNEFEVTSKTKNTAERRLKLASNIAKVKILLVEGNRIDLSLLNDR